MKVAFNRRYASMLFAALLSVSLLMTSAHANEQLMENSGCISCHRINEKLIGPAYKEVAKKYRSSSREQVLAYLTIKVREGGEGVWGEIPMAPNPSSKVSDEDLRTVLEWILGL